MCSKQSLSHEALGQLAAPDEAYPCGRKMRSPGALASQREVWRQRGSESVFEFESNRIRHREENRAASLLPQSDNSRTFSCALCYRVCAQIPLIAFTSPPAKEKQQRTTSSSSRRAAMMMTEEVFVPQNPY